MNKLRIVIDTNTLISSVLIAASVPDQAFKKARDIGILLFSDATFEELQQVITRPKFDRYISIAIRIEFLARLWQESEQVEIVDVITDCQDPKDNKFLEVAVNGDADYILTGDQDLLILNPFRAIPIVPPAYFLDLTSK
ncbi:putative toxin-antitoxin system toxin component, PIN family [Leptodesmis sichuanensis]|uniref:putative toxin-antitoxin system toxin component, PIN family n=1 Tax=Leptodesmis sichuanensis TaxID=2906798 RepID=UPI001F4034CF|nr:putative toxin-antitoxin system toxin component, PIN family [Leptodesmis sichuanensis]UIE39422.1 putative toxin-antitoxin system toxin component, PIN family [Leptodesmis sichuanensis A121]